MRKIKKMKQLNIYLEDSEFEELKKVKEDKTWHDLVLTVLKQPYEVLLQYLNEKNIEYSKQTEEYTNKKDENSKSNAIYFSAKRLTIKEIIEYIEGL